LDNWIHIQKLYYEQLPFKCKSFHEYGHFANKFPSNKKPSEVEAPRQEDGWKKVRKKTTATKITALIHDPRSLCPLQNPHVKTLPQNPHPKSLPLHPPNTPLSRNPFDMLGETSSKKNPPSVLNSSSPPDPPLIGIIDDSDTDDPSMEEAQVSTQQENSASNLHTQYNQEKEEGEIPPEKPRKSGRRTNKEVKEETTAKEKAQGKQQTIEHSIYTSTRKEGTRGLEHSVHGSRAPSNPL
jgi:hypothetical protein